MVNTENYIEELKKTLNAECVLTEDFQRYVYSADWSVRTPSEICLPDVVVCPQSIEDVVKTVKIAYKYGIPVTCGGGLTGMAGGAVPIYGGIYIDTRRLDRIIEIDVDNQTATVEAGITLEELNEGLKKYNLWLPNLPESKWSCTIGSEIACDNDSTFGLKYGKILNALLSVQIVTGTGELLELGHRKAHFTSTGYKLKDLIVGSEGTLGVITMATLKVEPLPELIAVDMYLFKSMGTGVKFLSELLKAGVTCAGAHINCKNRLKFYTHSYFKKYGRPPQVPEWANCLVALVFTGSKEVVAFHREYAHAAALRFEGEKLKEQEIVESWWISKHTLQFEPFKQKWPDSQRVKKFAAADPGIPMGRLEEFYQKFLEVAAKYKLEVLGMNAYLEQPNSIGLSLSCAVFVDYRDQAEVDRFRQYFKELTKCAVDFEGTMSTYMGDTDLKVEQFEYEHGKSAEYMREIKTLFDPKWIMNPGKKFKIS